jgi:hypothetical protein
VPFAGNDRGTFFAFRSWERFEFVQSEDFGPDRLVITIPVTGPGPIASLPPSAGDQLLTQTGGVAAGVGDDLLASLSRLSELTAPTTAGVVAAAGLALNGSGRQPAGAAGATDSATVLGRALHSLQGAALTERRVAETSLAGLPFQSPADFNGDLPQAHPLQPVGLAPAVSQAAVGLAPPIPSAPGEGTAPQARAEPRPDLSAPEGAGLLTSGLRLGLGAVDQAVKALLGPAPRSGGDGPALLRWLGVCSWVLGGALAYVVARRRRDLPAVGLRGLGVPGGAPFHEEELP